MAQTNSQNTKLLNYQRCIFTQSTHLHFKRCLVNACLKKRFPHQNSGPATFSSIQVQHIVPKDIIKTVCLQRLLLCNILNSALNSSCLGINNFFIIPHKPPPIHLYNSTHTPSKQTVTLKGSSCHGSYCSTDDHCLGSYVM